MPTYSAIVVPNTELDLDKVVLSGQTFRWQRDDEGWWVSPITAEGDVLRLLQRDESLMIESRGGDALALAIDYLQLDVSLTAIRDGWSNCGEHELVETIDQSPGLRIVRQDPVECLFAFLCSSAAPIHRIRHSVEGMCRLLGNDLGIWHGVNLRSFPSIDALASVPRAELDKLGLGFRGRYIIEAARSIRQLGGRPWLVELRKCSYDEAKIRLMSLPGVGEKVADCVCLFSLDKSAAVPIDVHMARVARRQFAECSSFMSVTTKAYAVSSDCFRKRYGKFAGWAQQYFFYAEIERNGLWDQQLGRHRPKLR
jgi:N-glycosylase/DNA lyase